MNQKKPSTDPQKLKEKIRALEDQVATLQKENEFLKSELRDERDLLQPYLCQSNRGERLFKRFWEYFIPNGSSSEKRC